MPFPSDFCIRGLKKSHPSNHPNDSQTRKHLTKVFKYGKKTVQFTKLAGLPSYNIGKNGENEKWRNLCLILFTICYIIKNAIKELKSFIKFFWKVLTVGQAAEIRNENAAFDCRKFLKGA